MKSWLLALDDLEVVVSRDNSGSEISEGGGGGKASAVDQGRQRWSELGFAVAL